MIVSGHQAAQRLLPQVQESGLEVRREPDVSGGRFWFLLRDKQVIAKSYTFFELIEIIGEEFDLTHSSESDAARRLAAAELRLELTPIPMQSLEAILATAASRCDGN